MKILVPVDGSEYSLNAVDQACALALSQGPSEVLLLAVTVELYFLEDQGHYVTEKMELQAEAALARAKDRALQKGVAPVSLIARGTSVAEEVVRVAEAENVDLLVIGSRGLGAKTASFLGGTASKVVTYSPCSVLVVKQKER
ncbi:MAG: universal stress protein [Deltaproteobacteria bacterium]|nr:universal stress protein [Deltaproteobacteria bacterium]